MIVIRFIVVAVLAVAVLGGGEISIGRPAAAWYAGIIVAALIIGALGFLLGAPHRKRETLTFYIAPLTLWAAAFFTLLVAEGVILRHFVAVITAILVGVYGTNLALATTAPARYEAFSLASIVQVLGLATVFFISFDVFSLMAYVQLPALVAPAAIFGFTGLSTYIALTLANISARRMLPHLIIVPLLAAEAGLALTFLPFTPPVLATIMALMVYAAGGLVREHARTSAVLPRLVRRYAVVAVGALALVIGTAPWP